MKEFTVEAKTENLDKVLELINGELEAAGCGMVQQGQLDIAVEEIFVNIASYAYEDGSGNAVISIDIKGEPPAAEITFLDSGSPYDPLKKPDPDITQSAEDRKIGGLGIFMVKKSMDEMRYEYTGGKNVLTISKIIK